jgi:hypothetical protein
MNSLVCARQAAKQREVALSGVQVEDYLDRTERCFFGVAGSTELLEPLIVVSGGGTAKDEIARVAAVSPERRSDLGRSRGGESGLGRDPL